MELRRAVWTAISKFGSLKVFTARAGVLAFPNCQFRDGSLILIYGSQVAIPILDHLGWFIPTFCWWPPHFFLANNPLLLLNTNPPQGWHLSPFFTFSAGCDQSCVGDDASCREICEGPHASLDGIWLLHRGQTVTSTYQTRKHIIVCKYVHVNQKQFLTHEQSKYGLHTSSISTIMHHMEASINWVPHFISILDWDFPVSKNQPAVGVTPHDYGNPHRHP